MSWNDLTQNPRVILAYYSTPPELDAVEVHSLLLHRDGGPTIEVVVELPVFPNKPSPRWEASANAVQARFRFFGLRDVRIEGWDVTNIGRLVVSPAPGGVRFDFQGGRASCVGVSDWFDIAGISAYTRKTT